MRKKFNSYTKATILLAMVSFAGAAGCINETIEDGLSSEDQKSYATGAVFSTVMGVSSLLAASVSHTSSSRREEDLDAVDDEAPENDPEELIS